MWVERGESEDLLCVKMLLYFSLFCFGASHIKECDVSFFMWLTNTVSFMSKLLIHEEYKIVYLYTEVELPQTIFSSFFSWRSDKRISLTPLCTARAIIIQSFCLRQQITRESVLRRKSQILMFISKQPRRKDFNWTKLLNGAKNWIEALQ